MFVFETDIKEDDERSQSPSQKDVLHPTHHPIALDHVSHQGIHVEGLEHHEAEAGREEEMNHRRDRFAQRLWTRLIK